MRFPPEICNRRPAPTASIFGVLPVAAWIPVLVALLFAIMSLQACQQADTDYVAGIDAWHAKREAQLAGESGWLTLVGLYPLSEGANRIGSSASVEVKLSDKAPAYVGQLTVWPDSVVLEVADRVPVRVKGQSDEQPISRLRLQTDAQGAPTVLELGSLSFYVIQRGDQEFLRVKDSESLLRKNFKGIERFPVADRWRVTAHLEAGDSTRTVAVPNVLGQLSQEPSCGTLVFQLAGRTCHLIPIGDRDESLFIVFADRTTGKSTYRGGRFLSTDPVSPDGTVVLDFNKATNPPCAFTPYATCPLPPEGNTLPVSVEAGEKVFQEQPR